MLIKSISNHATGFSASSSQVARATHEGRKTPSLVKRTIGHFFSKPKSKYDVLKRLLSAGIISYALAKTPFLWIGVNNTATLFGLLPRANSNFVILPFSNELLHNKNFDSFIEHTRDFEKLHAAIHEGGINNIGILDLDDNGLILDKDIEYENLISILEKNKNKIQDPNQLTSYEEGIKLLKEYRELNNILWGKEDLKPNNIHQVRDNCQIVTDIIGSCYTQENIQKLKSLVRVTDYNLDKNNFHINSIVKLNGKFVQVNYSELRNWRGIKPNGAPEAPYIIAYAIEKELKQNHLPNPYIPASSASILLSRQDYSLIPTFALSNEALIKILNETPNQIIKVGSYPELVDYYGRIKGYFTNESPWAEEEIVSKIKPYHEYVVKNVRYKNDELIITVSTTNPDHQKYEEAELTLPEFKNNMLTIAAPTDFIPYIDSKSLQTYLISLALLLLVRAGFMKLEKSKNKSEVK